MSDLSAVVAGLFEKYDSDKDGTLSAPELEVFYNDLAASRPDLASGDYNAWFGAIDKDGDGRISPPELEAYLASVNYTA
jgi:Ca2+-binding EF-hand superfamily protein